MLGLCSTLGFCSAWHCSAWSHLARSWTSVGFRGRGVPIVTFGLILISGATDPIGFTEYLATGHFIVWHCFMCRVLLLEALSWLLWCSARGWRCTALTSMVVAGSGLVCCSAWSCSIMVVVSLGLSTSLLGPCPAWHCSAWSSSSRFIAGGRGEVPVAIMGGLVVIWVRDPSGFTEYLATGHFVVWHCIICRVLLLEVLSWLLWCSARSWWCSAWSSMAGARLLCSAWSRFIMVVSLSLASSLLCPCLAWPVQLGPLHPGFLLGCWALLGPWRVVQLGLWQSGLALLVLS